MRLIRLFIAARKALPRAIPLLRDARVPFALKAGAGVCALFILSPINVLGDIPFLGMLDDAALLTLVCVWFVRFASRHVEPSYARTPGRSGALAPR